MVYFKDPFELLHNMRNIEYGVWDEKNQRKVYDNGIDAFHVLEPITFPEVTWQHQIGSCWECVLFEYDQIIRMKNIIKDVQVVWMEKNPNSSHEECENHTTILFETLNNQTYWFEHSWQNERGIWGPFRNKNYLLEEIKNRGEFNFINPKIDILKLFKKDLITSNDMILVGRSQ